MRLILNGEFMYACYRIKFNAYNICDYRNINDKDGRGPVDWNVEQSPDTETPNEIYVGFPIIASKAALKVDKWPTRDEKGNLYIIVHGITLFKTN